MRGDQRRQQSAAAGPSTRARTRRSTASRSTRSPARVGERREQQRGVHRGVQPRRVADPPGARSGRCRGRCSTRRSRSGRQVRTTTSAGAGGGPPVDRADVVALDVVAQRVELGALPAHPHRRAAVELAQPGQPAGQVPARRGTGGSTRTAPGTAVRRLAARQPQRADRAHGDAVGRPVAAAGRAQRVGRGAARRRGRRSGCRVGRARRGRPRVAHHAAHAAPARCSSRQLGLWPARRAGPRGARRARSRRRTRRRPPARRRRRRAATSEHATAATPASRRPAARAGRAGEHGTSAARAGQRHGGRPLSAGRARRRATLSSTPSTVTPSSSASGRSATRWRSVGRASALTSSGVTKSRPRQPGPGPASRSSAVAPRGDTPSASDGDVAGRAGEVDDVAERPRADRRPGGPASAPAARSAGPATGADPGARRGRAGRSRRRAASTLELVLPRRQRMRHLEQEAVELRLGQRVGALVLDRVLRGERR